MDLYELFCQLEYYYWVITLLSTGIFLLLHQSYTFSVIDKLMNGSFKFKQLFQSRSICLVILNITSHHVAMMSQHQFHPCSICSELT